MPLILSTFAKRYNFRVFLSFNPTIALQCEYFSCHLQYPTCAVAEYVPGTKTHAVKISGKKLVISAVVTFWNRKGSGNTISDGVVFSWNSFFIMYGSHSLQLPCFFEGTNLWMLSYFVLPLYYVPYPIFGVVEWLQSITVFHLFRSRLTLASFMGAEICKGSGPDANQTVLW